MSFLPARKSRLLNRLMYWALVVLPARASFRAVWLRSAGPPPEGDLPLIVFCNHCGWWDAHMVMLVNERVLKRDGYAMAEDTQLERYPFFRALGLFSVNRSDPRSAMRSVAYAVDLLRERPRRMLLIMPQGRILANDVRPLGFESGIAHVVRRLGACVLLPVALRYEFIGEQKPEALISLGAPITLDDGQARAVNAKAFTVELEGRVTAELDRLRDDVRAYRFEAFRPLAQGTPSINRWWDWVRGKRQITQIGPGS